MIISNEAQLRALILRSSQAAIKAAEERIYAVIKKTLVQYYSEFEPDEYIRTLQLLHSLVKTQVISTGNGFEAKVYFDADMLNYQKGVIPTQHGTGYATWGADEVLDTAMNGSHGGYISGTAVWGTSMAVLGDICNLIVQELIKQGIPVVKG